VQVLSTEFDGNLLVGGALSHVNGTFVNGLASFDGTTWTALGVGLNEPAAVYDVATYHGDLIASGSEIDVAGSHSVARWNGSSWSGFGSGLDPFDLFGTDIVTHAFGTDLSFGGNVSGAGPNPSAFIARWTDAAVDAPEVAAAAALRLDLAGANPFRAGTSFAFSLPRAGDARVSVHDAAGRLVRVLSDGAHEAGAHRAEWNGRNGVGKPVGSGVYFVRLSAEGGILNRKAAFTR
jgi:FlgD Ig-like domain